MRTLVTSSQEPTSDKQQVDAARNRSKSNIIKKINEIKQAFRQKNQDEKKREPSSTILPTFQTDMPSPTSGCIKYFVPVIAETTSHASQSFGVGDNLFFRYQIQTITFDSSAFTLYEGAVIDSGEKVQIKVYTRAHTYMGLNQLTSYMHLYEGRVMEEGWLTRLKDFFFYKSKLVLVLQHPGPSISKLQSSLTTDIVKSITLSLLERIDSFHEEGLLHLNINPSWIHVPNQNYAQVQISNLVLAQGKQKESRFDWQGYPTEGLNYWSPESLLQLPIDEKSDVWSIGCTLFWLICGHPFVNPELSSKQAIYIIKRCLSKTASTKKHSAFLLEGFDATDLTKTTGCRMHLIEQNIRQTDQRLLRIESQDRQLYDLLTNMLRISPLKRCSIEMAMRHPWLSL